MGGAALFIGKSLIVMITSAKLLHLPSLEIPFLPSGIIGWERMHQTEAGKMPPNLGQFLVPGMRAAGRFACVSCSSDRETAQLIGRRFSTTEIGENWRAPVW